MTAFGNIDRLLKPKSIAILGCSETNAGGMALRNLLDNGFRGPIYPVHPTRTEVAGIKAYPTLASITAEVDCCIVALRAELVLGAVEEIHAKQIKAAVIYASGFSELGESGTAIQTELSQRLEKYEIAACGPNCLGLIGVPQNAAMYYAGLDIADKRGPIALISHSGSSCIALTNAERGTGFSYVISCGNEAGISVPDYVRFLADDPDTQIIALHLEAIRDPAGLADAARLALARNKPIVVLKLGRTEAGQRTAAAHSGALATPAALTAAYFARNSMLLVDSLDELQETCELLVYLRNKLPKSEGVAVTAVSGGMAGLSADIGSEEGVTFADLSEQTTSRLRSALSDHSTPGNPLDVTTALHDPLAYRTCIEILMSDPAVGLVMVCQGAEPGLNKQQRDLYAPIARMMADLAATQATPIATFSPIAGGLERNFNATLRRAYVPQLMGATASLRAVRHLMEWRQFKIRPDHPQPFDAGQKRTVELGVGPTLSERHGKELLNAYGIQTPQERLVESADQAVIAANAIGYPIVMKVDTPDILHKTEAGIVALGLADANTVRSAYVDLMDNARNYDPAARLNGISVQELVPAGVEMVLGIKNDPQFGPAVIVGAGGIYAEVLNDVALRLAPVGPIEAEAMLTELRCNAILNGVRGSGPADRVALIDAICAVSNLAVHYRDEIAELDINPIVVFPKGEGLRALDALIVRASSIATPRPRP